MAYYRWGFTEIFLIKEIFYQLLRQILPIAVYFEIIYL